MRRLHWAYRVSVTYDVCPGYEKTARFPGPRWWGISAMLLTPDGEYRLADGGRVTVISPTGKEAKP